MSALDGFMEFLMKAMICSSAAGELDEEEEEEEETGIDEDD